MGHRERGSSVGKAHPNSRSYARYRLDQNRAVFGAHHDPAWDPIVAE
jgi:hypothetical protein